MRKLALAAFILSAVTGGFLGCGGSTPRKVTTGTAGTGGNGGTDLTGTAGTAGSTAGSGGDMGVAGGTAGTDAATGGTGGMDAGAAGATAGTGGETMDATPPIEVAPPPPAYCDVHPQGQLPYNIANGFKVIHILSNNNSAGYWKNMDNADCTDNPTYPPFPVADGGSDGAVEAPADGGADATSEAGATDATGDAGDETATLALVDPDAGDGGVADADAPIDVAAEAPASEGGSDAVASNDGGSEAGADAGPPLPACYEFSYDPDGCTGTCWAGVVFEVTDVQGPSADTKGVCIQHGAMGIEFMARSSKNNANVKFGSIGEGVGNTEFYKLITTTWARYVITIPAQDQQSYDETAGDMQGVWNAFSIVVDNADYVGGAYIEVKDIHWIAAAQ